MAAVRGRTSPTVLREGGYRFYFFSREEPRMHVHCADGEAEFWIEPRIELAQTVGINERQLRIIQALVEAHVDDIRRAWQQHFGA